MRVAPFLLSTVSGCLLLVDPFPDCVPEDCFGGYGCDWQQDVCASSCDEDSDCQDTHYCAVGECWPRCVEEDCPLGCSPLTETCRCDATADCPTGEVCCTSQRVQDDECTRVLACF